MEKIAKLRNMQFAESIKVCPFTLRRTSTVWATLFFVLSMFLVCTAEETLPTPPLASTSEGEAELTSEAHRVSPRNATNELDLAAETDTLTLVMEKSGLVKFKFTLYCVHPSVKYSLSLSTGNPSVAAVDTSALFNISCADAVPYSESQSGADAADITSNTASRNAGTTTDASVSRRSGTPGDDDSSLNVTAHPHPHDILLQAVPKVVGSINFTMYADVLGRTWLRIYGRRTADPDVALPVFLKFPWMPTDMNLLYTHDDLNESADVMPDSGHDSVSYDVHSGSGSPTGYLPGNESDVRELQRHVITVIRVVRPVDIAFRSILYGFVIIATVGMGCKTEISVVKKVLRKPVAPAIGFVCQYLFMPLIAFMLAKTLTVGDPAVSLGIFACGICPGGGPSNMFSYLLDGDVSLSVTMTAISSISALAMIPLWLFTLGSLFQDDKISLTVPFGRIIMTLAFLIIPLFIGILIKHKLPRVAKIIKKLLKPVSLLVIIFIVTFGIYANLYVFKLFAPRTLAAGCLLPYIGYTLGGLTSLILRQPCYRVKTIAIETGIQNTSIAYLLLIFSLPTPDGDMAAVGPAASAIMTPLPLFVLVVVYLLYKRFCKKKEEKNGGEEVEDDDDHKDEEAVALNDSPDVKEENGSTMKNGEKNLHSVPSLHKTGTAESEKFVEEKDDNEV